MFISDFKLLERLLKPAKIYNLYYFKPFSVFSIDSRSLRSGQAFIAIKGKYHDGHEFIKRVVSKGASLVIAERYIPTKRKIPFYVVDDTQGALAQITAYVRVKKKPFVYGVAGSLGKTTTKDMLSFLLEPECKVLKNKRTENNFLGVSKTMLSLDKEKVVILELGTNAKGEIELLSDISRPDVGIVTFIKPVHLQGLKSMQGIYKEKISLFKANPKMKAVLNRDDPYLARVDLGRKTYWFGRSENNDIFARLVKRTESGSVFIINNKYSLTLPLNREIFITNALAAILSAHLLGIPYERLVKRMNSFSDFPSMRMQVCRLKGFFILNDAYNSNPYSFRKALESLKNYPLRKIAVVGDMLELGNKSRYYHEQLAYMIKESNLDYCLTFGGHSLCLKQKLRELGYKKAFHFRKKSQIAEFINNKTKGDNELKKRYLIFLKASRNMELEKVIDYLR